MTFAATRKLSPIHFFILSIFSVWLPSCNFDDRQIQSKPVIRVDDRELAAKEFSEILVSRLREFNDLSARDANVVNQTKNSIIQDFIVRVVTEKWAEKNQVFVRKEDLDRRVSEVRSSYTDEISFKKALALQGYSFEQWRDQIESSLLERLVVQSLQKQVPQPTEQNIKKYYDENKTSFSRPAKIRVKQIATREQFQAETIHKELKSGKKFAALYSKYGTGDGSSASEWIEQGAAEFYDQLQRLSPNQYSSVIKSSFGFHIFEVQQKVPGKTLTLADATNEIKRRLYAQTEQEMYSQWLERQILQTRIYKDDDLIQKIQVYSRSPN
jgi:peptidyl-prolyl cis-trans isomerase C